MTPSIPAKKIANVLPNVLSAGGNPLSLNAVFLTNDPSIPFGTVQPFASATDVENWFGAQAIESILAAIYFSGYNGALTRPSVLFFTQFNTATIAAYLRGGSVTGMTLAQLQAISGLLSVVIDGAPQVSSNINLAGATSFTNAATLITNGLHSATGRFAGTAVQTAAANVMNVTVATSGSLQPGDVLTGAGVDAGLTVVSQVDGTPGGVGHYTVSTTTGFASTAISVAGVGTCTYDSLRKAFVITSPTLGVNSSIAFASNTIAVPLFLTSATGAVLSQGAIAQTPAEVMDNVVEQTQNWATFMTMVEQTLSNKIAFATWLQGKNDRYAYSCQDSDITALQANSAGTFGAIMAADEFDGVWPIYDITGGQIAAFICGASGSIAYAQPNSRITFAFKSQPGLAAQITNETDYDNLIGNGYNCYAAFATANDQFVNFQPGQAPGRWKWMDPYINQIYFNSQLQLALVELESNVPILPYNNKGYGQVRAALMDPIQEALANGTIQAGVQLSDAQIAEVNTAAGVKIDTILFNTGWYLQILSPPAQTRTTRGSPIMTLWYTDGGAIQTLNLTSTDVM